MIRGRLEAALDHIRVLVAIPIRVEQRMGTKPVERPFGQIVNQWRDLLCAGAELSCVEIRREQR